MSYVIKNFESGLWTVGHYQPDGKFDPEGDYTDQVAAGQRCHFLNGGTDTALREQYDKVLKSAMASAKAIGVLLEERAGLYAVAVLARDFDALGISADALRQQARAALKTPVDMSWWPDGNQTGATS